MSHRLTNQYTVRLVCGAMGSLKPATHLAILYADRRDRRKSPGVPGAVIAIFADRRDRLIKSPISGMSDIGDLNRRHSPSVPVPAKVITANRQ